MDTNTNIPIQIILSSAQRKELDASKKELAAGNFKNNADLDKQVRSWLNSK